MGEKILVGSKSIYVKFLARHLFTLGGKTVFV